MDGDPVASLNTALGQLEKTRRQSIKGLEEAASTVAEAAKGRSSAAGRDLRAAAKQAAAAAERLGSLQFHGSYKGTNASFLGATERRLLAGIAIGAAALLGGWIFLIATLAAARLEPGQELALGGVWILVGLVAGFLLVALALAYGFRPVHVSLRAVDGEVAEVDRAEELRARRRLERQVNQATRDAERATKRAEKAEAESDQLRARLDEAEERVRSLAEQASVEPNGSVDKATGEQAARASKRTG